MGIFKNYLHVICHIWTPVTTASLLWKNPGLIWWGKDITFYPEGLALPMQHRGQLKAHVEKLNCWNIVCLTWNEYVNETIYCSPLPTLENKLEWNPDGIITKSPPEESGEVSEKNLLSVIPSLTKWKNWQNCWPKLETSKNRQEKYTGEIFLGKSPALAGGGIG